MQTFPENGAGPGWAPSPWSAGDEPRPRLNGAAARQARQALPYLGPDPAPSLPVGRAFAAVCALGALVRVVEAVGYVQRASLDRKLAVGIAVRDELDRNTSFMNALAVLRLSSWVAFFVLLVLWGRRRRPKATLQRLGESYVESPYRWVVTAPFQVVLFVPVIAAVIANSISSSSVPPTASRLASHRMWSAFSSGMWALYYAVMVGAVVLCERALRERLAASGAHRAGAAPIPYVPAVGPTGVLQAEPVRGGWIVRTMVLSMGLIVGTFGLIAALAQADAAGLLWAVVFAAIDAAVIRAFVRRHRASHPKVPQA